MASILNYKNAISNFLPPLHHSPCPTKATLEVRGLFRMVWNRRGLQQKQGIGKKCGITLVLSPDARVFLKPRKYSFPFQTVSKKTVTLGILKKTEFISLKELYHTFSKCPRH